MIRLARFNGILLSVGAVIILITLAIVANTVLNTPTHKEDIEKSYNILDMIPFEYASESETGVASLSMLFQYYGNHNVSFDEIESVSFTNMDGNRGTPINGFLNALNYDDYSFKKFGYEADVVSLDENTSDERWEIITGKIDEGQPIVLCTRARLDESLYIAYRIMLGYDERPSEKLIYFHDPYSGDDISTGPISEFPYTEFERRWANINHYMILINKINIEYELTSKGSERDILCRIDLSRIFEVDSISLEIQIPANYTLEEGNNLESITSNEPNVTKSWKVSSYETEIYDTFKIQVRYTKNSNTFGEECEIFLNKPQVKLSPPLTNSMNDIVGFSFNLEGGNSSFEPLVGELSIKYYNGSDFPPMPVHSILVETETNFSQTIGPFYPGEEITGSTFFIWLELNIPELQEIYYSPLIVVYINFNLDLDGDSMSDGYELIHNLDPVNPDDALEDYDNDGLINLDEAQYNTNARDADSDNDGMNDKDEIDNGYDPLDFMSNGEVTSVNRTTFPDIIFLLIISLILSRKKQIQ
jgi:hypothetical protein